MRCKVYLSVYILKNKKSTQQKLNVQANRIKVSIQSSELLGIAFLL